MLEYWVLTLFDHYSTIDGFLKVITPVETGVQRNDDYLKNWIPAGVYPGESRGRNDRKTYF